MQAYQSEVVFNSAAGTRMRMWKRPEAGLPSWQRRQQQGRMQPRASKSEESAKGNAAESAAQAEVVAVKAEPAGGSNVGKKTEKVVAGKAEPAGGGDEGEKAEEVGKVRPFSSGSFHEWRWPAVQALICCALLC